MAWVKLDDKIFLNRKFAEASDGARLTYLAGLTYVAQAESDGRIAAAAVAIVAAYARQADPSAVVAELVRLRLWEAVEGGYEIHDYLAYNPSREALEAERKRKRDWAASHSGANSASSGRSSDETIAASRSRSRSRSGSPARPQETPEDCAEPAADGPAAAPAEPGLLVFPCAGPVKKWSLTEPVRAELAEAFPAVDVIACAKKALEWCRANPKKIKTAKRMRGWLGSVWCAGEQDHGSPQQKRDIRFGHVRAENFKHTFTGELDLDTGLPVVRPRKAAEPVVKPWVPKGDYAKEAAEDRARAGGASGAVADLVGGLAAAKGAR